MQGLGRHCEFDGALINKKLYAWDHCGVMCEHCSGLLKSYARPRLPL